MTRPGFLVRFFQISDDKTLDYIGNFKDYGNREDDEVVVFTGMYGLTSYMVWYLHHNLQHYDFSSVGLDLRLFLEGTTRMPFWTGKYRVLTIMFDTEENRYVVFATSESSATLETKLTDYGVTTLKYKENRKAKDVLIDILEPYNIFKVHYFEHEQEEQQDNFEYRYFNIDENWTVLNFINYICDENQYEWALRNNVLYVGKELKAYTEKRSGRVFNVETDHISTSSFFQKYSGETRPMDILSHVGKEWRCVWAKHWVGKSGGISRGCFTSIGAGTLDKSNYFSSLEGNYEKTNATILLTHNSPSHYILLGNILKDEGLPREIDEVSIQTPLDLMKVTDPNFVKFERGTETEGVILTKEKVARTTQYLDNEAGLQFPSSSLQEDQPPPNSIIFNIQGKEHMSAIGPFVMGTEKEDKVKIPVKEKEDFRLRFTDGAEIFYDASKETWYFQAPKGWVFKQATTSYDGEPVKTRLTEDENMFQIYDGNILWDTKSSHMHLLDGGCFQVVPKTGPQGTGNRRYAISGDNENGEVIIGALNEIKLRIEDGLGVLAVGTITIDVGAGGLIKLGGGGNKLAYLNHDHLGTPMVGNLGMPISGSTAPNTAGTTKTEGD